MKFRLAVIILFGIIAFPHSGLAQKKVQLDSLWGAFHNEKFNDSLRVNAIHTITIKLAYADPDSGLSAGKDYLRYIREKKADIYYSGAYNAIGSCYLNKGNLDSALANYEKSLQYRILFKEKRGEASALNNIGIVYYQWGDYSRCLEYYQRSLSIKDSLGDKTGVASSYSNIGMINEILGDEKRALQNYRMSLHLRDSLNDDRGLGDSHLKIGGVMLSVGNTDSALYYVRRGIYFSEKAEDQRTVITGILNLGNVFVTTGPCDSAEYYYKLASWMNTQMGNEEGVAMAQNDLGFFLVEQKRYSEGVKYCDSALAISSRLGFPELELKACQCLGMAFDALNQPAKALYYYKMADTLRDSLTNIDKTKALNRKSLEYEFRLDKMTDSLRLAQEADLQEAIHSKDLQAQKYYTYMGIGGFVLMLVLAVVLLRGYRQKQNTNLELERKNLLIEEKQKSILDSISYAKRLQEAILPSMITFRKYIPSGFVIYKPKDIVAGDFYWLEHINGITFVAAADCTGHGVPGAMVSVVCSTALNRCVLEFDIRDTGKILDRTRELVLETFSKSDNDVKDGMDISLLAIHNDHMQWSGANNPVWIIENGKLTELKGDKQPIGKTEQASSFHAHQLELNKGARIYLLTDGYADQFGGPHGKKFKYKQLEQLLIETCHLPMAQQQQKLDEAFEKWKGNLEQVDDVCLIGIEIR